MKVTCEINQGGLCLICKKEPEETWHIDHCHITGKVRGLLCRKCNNLLGFAEDNIDTLKNAILYLDSNKFEQGEI